MKGFFKELEAFFYIYKNIEDVGRFERFWGFLNLLKRSGGFCLDI
jgi:hypothetical protein